MTFIYVTHDQEEALSMSDEVAILRDGKLVQSGAPSALYDQPRTRFVADFLGKSNFLDGVVDGPHHAGVTYRCGPHRFLQACPGDVLRPGQPIVLSLRPEKIALTADEPPGAVNVLAAELVSWSYFGSGVHVLVAAAGIGQLAVTRQSWRLDVPLSAGKRVWLSWDADAATPVAEDS